jgi:hypothetical protein
VAQDGRQRMRRGRMLEPIESHILMVYGKLGGRGKWQRGSASSRMLQKLKREGQVKS